MSHAARNSTTSSPHDNFFAKKLYELSRGLHRLCGPHENVSLIIHQGISLYQQDTSTPEKLASAIKFLGDE